jgi:hypothetical protein
MEYEVVAVEPYWYSNDMGNPVEGYRISFRLATGEFGYAYAPRKGFNADAAANAVKEEIARILELKALGK